MQTKTNEIVKGIFWAAVASGMWGISGTVLQFISQDETLPISWFLSVRTLGAGIILLTISFIKYRWQIFDIFKSWRLIGWLLAYAVLGLMANLITFFISVKTGNAAAATILQYLSPLFIVLGSLVFKKQKPFTSDLISFLLSLAGVFLVITQGNFSQLAIPLASLLWGIGSGITAACYIVLPKPVLRTASPIVVLGWGTFLAGVFFNLYHPFWLEVPTITPAVVASVGTVILLGTILPFSLLLYSLHFAPSDVVSIMDAVQPIVTSILSVIFLSLKMNWVEVLGICLVLIAIYYLQRGRRQAELENIK
ncbi:MAG: DMT family transporter [Liquorilactobacillus nagelii]|jgi:drug/metabolite transporter (DMT)-like permease|uniref:EamA family transporter n=1 Tax=Liquorilactobacillus nagelii TaxID=82688 RepID=A0A3S6QY15_9LACO|nr:DMT family transporter [Liquorilactobacillus nagelii]AUJ32968.1 EamA family transporter [Liquorilactobacillus nagelii]KRL41630.1 DMT family permease [Liquorilactobacillus nagelii DSM 13675]MCC7616573.1 EamA family transporter [Liquorilactobacillus nagelii]MCI1700469.1 DMT family transporter [Liquorilactobacillus nagelii]MCI1920877.1 DMT family transporter [Liquorilactobacillus nagelii]